jgi:hypothetical protein
MIQILDKYGNTSTDDGRVIILDKFGDIKKPAVSSGTVTSILTASPITGGLITTTGTIGITQATTSTDGYLSSTDWTAFNSKFNLPSLTSGSVLFSNGTTIAQDNANFFWDNTNKRLGIGTASPTTLLDIQPASGTPVLRVARTGGTDLRMGASTTSIGAVVGTYTDSPLNFYTNSLTKVTINSSGDLLVGTGTSAFSSPGRGILQVNGAVNSILALTNNNVRAGYLYHNGSDLSVWNEVSGALIFGTNNVEGMRMLSSNRYIGIGTTAPTARLQVTAPGALSTDIALKVRNSANTADLLSIAGNGNVTSLNGFTIGSTLSAAGIFPSGVFGKETINIRSSLIPADIGNDIIIQNGQGNVANLSSIRNLVQIGSGFNPTSGTGIYNFLQITATINQTGGANGVTRGLFINPALTSAADFRAIETTVGNVILGSTSGNVGIGTTTPAYKLDIVGFANSTSGFRVTDGTIDNRISWSSGNVGFFGTVSNHPIAFNTNLSERMRITSSGNVGIGTTSPAAKLHTVGDGLFSSNTNTNLTINSNGGVSILTLTTSAGTQSIYGGVGGLNNMDFYTASGFRMRIDPTGNVGIGTSTPVGRLDVRAPGALSIDTAFRVRNSADSNNLMIINGAGGIGVGTTSPLPSAVLDINSTTQGFLPPRMTNAQRLAIATPAVGLCVYCTDAVEGLYINKSTGWTYIG